MADPASDPFDDAPPEVKEYISKGPDEFQRWVRSKLLGSRPRPRDRDTKIRELEEENRTLREQAEEKAQQQAEKQAEEIRRQAKKEAEEIRRQAKKEAEEIRRQAEETLRQSSQKNKAGTSEQAEQRAENIERQLSERHAKEIENLRAENDLRVKQQAEQLAKQIEELQAKLELRQQNTTGTDAVFGAPASGPLAPSVASSTPSSEQLESSGSHASSASTSSSPPGESQPDAPPTKPAPHEVDLAPGGFLPINSPPSDAFAAGSNPEPQSASSSPAQHAASPLGLDVDMPDAANAVSAGSNPGAHSVPGVVVNHLHENQPECDMVNGNNRPGAEIQSRPCKESALASPKTPLPESLRKPAMDVSEMGQNLAKTILQKIQLPEFDGTICVKGLDDIDLAGKIRKPDSEWDLLSVQYSYQNGACRLFVAKDAHEFKLPQFPPSTVQPPSQEEMEAYIEDICTNPPKEPLSYYVGPSLTKDGVPPPQLDSLLDAGELNKLPEMRSRALDGITPPEELQIQGVTSHYWHVGVLNTGTAWHKEDWHFWSVNITIKGIKIWMIVDLNHSVKFEEYVAERYGTYLCEQKIRHLSLILRPTEIREAGINFKLIAAGPGTAIVTRGGQYHSVLNKTNSLAVAINLLPLGHTLFPPTKTSVCNQDGMFKVAREFQTHFEVVSDRFSAPRSTQHMTPCRPRTIALCGPQRKAPRVKKDMGGKQRMVELEQTETAGLRRSSRTTDQATSNLAKSGRTGSKRSRPEGDESIFKRQKHAPSLKAMAEELICSSAKERLRFHVLAYRGNAPSPPPPWDDKGDVRSQVATYLRIGSQLEGQAQYCKMVGLTLTVFALNKAYEKEDGRVNLSREDLDQIKGEKSQMWITRRRKFCRLGLHRIPLLPFDDFGEETQATFVDYERCSNENLDKIKELIQDNSLKPLCEALIDSILQRATFIWQTISLQDLQELSIDNLLSLLTMRNLRENKLDWTCETRADLVVAGRQCELCEKDNCDCVQTRFPQQPRIVDRGSKGLALEAIGDEEKVAYQQCNLIGEITGRILPLETTREEDQLMDIVTPNGQKTGHLETTGPSNIFQFTSHKGGNSKVKWMAISGKYRMVLLATQDIMGGMEIAGDFTEVCKCQVCTGK
ncbi:hypothetical protein RB594_007881 [Gaeumannomyces avenae]